MTDWREVSGRVVLEASVPDPKDHVVCLGWTPILDVLAPSVGSITVVDPDSVATLPPGARYHRAAIDQPVELERASLVIAHWTWRRLPKARQEALALRLGRELRERALLVIGDVVWSVPPDSVDAPEQFGDALDFAPTADGLTGMLRVAGFLPDLHRFGPAVGVMIALRGNR